MGMGLETADGANPLLRPRSVAAPPVCPSSAPCTDDAPISYRLPVQKLKSLAHAHDGGLRASIKIHHRWGSCAVLLFQGSSDASGSSAPFSAILFCSRGIAFCNPYFTSILCHSAVTRNLLSGFWFVVQETDSHRIDSSDLAFILTCACAFLFSFFQEKGTNAYAINSP